jgi:hypothetical protein
MNNMVPNVFSIQEPNGARRMAEPRLDILVLTPSKYYMDNINGFISEVLE